MTDTSSSLPAKEQLEQLITCLVNAWLQQHTNQYDSQEMQEELVKKFCNLSLQTVYDLLSNDLLPEPVSTAPVMITRDIVQNSLRSGTFEQLEKSNPHDFMVRTDIRRWIRQKDDEGVTVSGRLSNILDRNVDSLICIEYISKRSLLACQNAGESAWKEFVKLRGY